MAEKKLMYFPENIDEITEYVDILLEKVFKSDYEEEKMLLHSIIYTMFNSNGLKDELNPRTVLYFLQMTASEDEEGETILDKLYVSTGPNIDNPSIEAIYWYLRSTDVFQDVVIRLMSIFQFYDQLFNTPIFSENGKTLLFYPNHLKYKTYTVPEGTEHIASHAFSSNSHIKTIKLPQTLKSIGRIAFNNLRNLKSILVNQENPIFYSQDGVLYENPQDPIIIKYPSAIPNTCLVIPQDIKKVKAFAFELCDNLTEVIIETGNIELEDAAFFNCNNIETVSVQNNDWEHINPSAFNGMILYTPTNEENENENDNDNTDHNTEGNIQSEIQSLEYRTPSEIKKMFDDYIVGHNSAKQTLAVAVYSHILRCNNPTQNIGKSNILLYGPTGCGKTEFARTIAKCLNVPFITADATSITETGMKGNDPTDMLKDLIVASDNNLEKAQNGIIYIDEIDKLATFGENAHRESYSKGVQQSLLKIIEGGIIPIRIETPMQQYTINFDTTNVLFIVGGAFSHMNKNKKTNQVGFILDHNNVEPISTNLPEARTFVKNGMTQEFIGRFPVIVELKQLTEDEIYRIMTEPKNSVVKQYKKLVNCIGSELVFEEDLLRTIAKNAIKTGTGARGIRTVIEKLVENIIFELPDKKNIKEVIVHKGMLNNQNPQYIDK